MAAIELYNRTAYPDEPLIEVAKFAKRVMKVKGDVAVIVRYHAHSSGFVGLMHPSFPFFRDVAGNLKKFANRKYMVDRKSYNPALVQGGKVAMATKDGAYGYITVRIPRPRKGRHERWTTADATSAVKTFVHEMRHIWQYRNQEEALAISGSPSWSHYIGYGNGRHYRRLAHQQRPIEQDVNKAIRDANLAKHPKYHGVVDTLASLFGSEVLATKAQKKRQSVKYNKYGERMSDYRNVKMNRLRNGDEVVRCPHCGEKAVILPIHHYDANPTYTHIASVDYETVRWGGYSANEARYTQFGHVQNKGGDWVIVLWGYADPKAQAPDEGVFRSYSTNRYRG